MNTALASAGRALAAARAKPRAAVHGLRSRGGGWEMSTTEMSTTLANG